MRFPGVLVLIPVWLLVVGADSPSPSANPSPSPSAAESPAPSPSPSPVAPTPTPVNAFLSLDVTAGPSTTVINVTGGQFLPNEAMTLYWDTPSHVAGSATADANGSFNTRVKPFAGAAPGAHRLCASVPPTPCANFALQATASPSPSPDESPSPSPSPSAEPTQTPSQVASPTRLTGSISGFDVITRPPFVFLPIFGFGAIALSLLYWAIMVIRRPRRQASIASAAVVHRATRPDYSVAFGTPPPAPSASSQPSAWEEPMRPTTPPGPPATAQPPAVAPAIGEPPPAVWSAGPAVPSVGHVPWGPGTPDSGYPELAPPADAPQADARADDGADIPQPGD